MSGHREFKDALYAQFARIGHALASPKRIELLDLLGQGEKTVELLAEQCATPIKNTSAHLRVLRQARLVDTRRDGTYVNYRLADDDVLRLLRTVETLGHQRLADVQQVVQQFVDRRDQLAPVTLKELRRLVREGEVTVVDVRPAEAFKLGHVPLAVNVPVQSLQTGPDGARHAATLLGQAGLDRSHEAVVVSEGGLSEQAALAFLVLENAGQRKASILLDSIERWAELGNEVARPQAPGQPATRPMTYAAQPAGLRMISEPGRSASGLPRVFIASGNQIPQRAPGAKVIHLPYKQFLNADGTPKAAKDIWSVMSKAGVPRYAEIVLYGDTPGEAAVNYVIFRLMGFADLKVWTP